LVRFEIMDGSPSRGIYFVCPVLRKVLTTLLGETIPIRLFLGGFDLTPTFREVNKKYSTRYYLSLVLIDEGMYFCSALSQPCYAAIRRVGICNPWHISPRLIDPPVNCPLAFAYLSQWIRSLTNRVIDARRYFKQSEIVLFRQAPENAQHLQIDMPSIGGAPPLQSPLVPA